MFEFLRNERLELARIALETDAASIKTIAPPRRLRPCQQLHRRLHPPLRRPAVTFPAAERRRRSRRRLIPPVRSPLSGQGPGGRPGQVTMKSV
jgi:hypothetical protein